MKKLFLILTVAVFAVSCSNPKATAPNAVVDLNQYSSGIQHVGIPTTNVQGTADFYAGLGFMEIGRFDVNGRDFSFMQLGNLVIEIIPKAETAMQNGAIDHICLDVKNIEELFEKLQKAGYKMLNESLVDFNVWENGTKLFFIEGPNKEKIEFCEIL